MGADDRAHLADEQGLAAEDLAAPLDEDGGPLGVLDVLDDPGVGAVVVAALQVLDHALERAAGRAHPLDRGDLGLEREDRLDLQRRAQPGAPPPTRPPRRRYSSVSTTNQTADLVAGLLGARQDRVRVGAAAGGARRRQRDQAEPSARGLRVQDADPLAAPALLLEGLLGLDGRLEGARDARRDVDRDDVAAGVQQRLPDLDEVADRGLRGGGQLGGGAQVLVVVVEAVELRLALLAAAPVDVETDQVQVVGVHDRLREVVRGVGDDGHVRHGADPIR